MTSRPEKKISVHSRVQFLKQFKAILTQIYKVRRFTIRDELARFLSEMDSHDIDTKDFCDQDQAHLIRYHNGLT